MPNPKLPIPENDDTRAKRERRSARRTKRKTENLSLADVPDRSCLTCERWTQIEDEWGECQDTMVVRERVKSEVFPPKGMDKGTVVARWNPPRHAVVTCIERGWDAARAYGQAQPLRTHRTFPACDRYVRQAERAPDRRRTLLRDRVQGRAA